LGGLHCLKAAVAKVIGCPRQRCTVHVLRNCVEHASRHGHGTVAALIRGIFNRPGKTEARDRLSEAITALDGKLPKGSGALQRRRGHPRLLCLSG
jgi:transposase-like protein